MITRIIAHENGELTALETLELFSELYLSGTIAGLQGSYQRSLAMFLDEGLIDPETGEVTDLARDRLSRED